jgi:hypothetical protein
MTTRQLIKAPGVKEVLIIYNYIFLMAFAYTAANPVFLFTPVNRGGFGFTPEFIALFLAAAGAFQAIWLLIIFPPLHSRIGTGNIIRLCALAWPAFFIVSPICNVLLRYNHPILFWIVAPVSLAVGSGVSMAFSTSFPSLP